MKPVYAWAIVNRDGIMWEKWGSGDSMKPRMYSSRAAAERARAGNFNGAKVVRVKIEIVPE